MQHHESGVAGGAIKGLVIPEQWNHDGEIVGVTIHTRHEEIFHVAHNDIGRELLAFVQQEVEAVGRIDERINGTTLITVKSYRVVDTADEAFDRYNLMR